jgi:hypothetical protein
LDRLFRPKTLRRSSRGVATVIFYAVVSDEIQRVSEFFPDRQAAEAMLKEVLGDEPDLRETLHVERIQLFTGTTN